MTVPLVEWVSSLFSFTVDKGQMCFLHLPEESSASSFINLLMGLRQIQNQIIKINGSTWNELNPYEQTSLRGQIRILHKTNAFINNLDLYENISLPLKHHNYLSDAEIMPLIEPYLTLFNSSSLLKLRPCEATDTQFKIAQWIRLFLGSPMLLILQNPEILTPLAFLPHLEELLKKHLSSGGGVLYLNYAKSLIFESLISKRYTLSNYESLLNSEKNS